MELQISLKTENLFFTLILIIVKFQNFQMAFFSKKGKSLQYIEATYPPKKLTDESQIKIVQTELEKLTKYAHFNPTKLDDIGEFIEKRLKKDISKLRPPYARVSLEIVDALLQSCQVISFFKKPLFFFSSKYIK